MEVNLPEAFEGLFQPYRFKAFHGGRGSAKSHSIAMALVLRAAMRPTRILCAREIQKSIKDSVKRLIDDKIREAGLEARFESLETEIRGANGSLFLFAGLKSNPDSIKSMEGLDIAWVEEAARVSQRSLDLLLPTLREDGSEIWFSWNPESEYDPVDAMFRGKHVPPRSLVREVSWRDNPWFPSVLREAKDFDYSVNPEKAAHIWDGAYQTFVEGSYYGKWLAAAKSEQRILDLPYTANEWPVETWWDLGHSDATAIWFVQPQGREFRVLDYYENNGVGLEHYASEILARAAKGMKFSRHILPHDAEAHELGTNLTRTETLRRLMPGHIFAITPRQSVDDGINAVREILPRCWFDKTNCAAGLKALNAYHEKIDETRRVGKGPEHDWASHGADAFRYGALMWRLAIAQPKPEEPVDRWKLAARPQRQSSLATL